MRFIAIISENITIIMSSELWTVVASISHGREEVFPVTNYGKSPKRSVFGERNFLATRGTC